MACGLFAMRLHGTVVLSRGRSLPLSSVLRVLDYSPDLRLAGCDTQWLVEASRNNYHDGDVLAKLASVMQTTNDSGDDDSESESENDEVSDSGLLEASDNQNRQRTFVTSVPLCLHCRRPTERLCPFCQGAYFCDETCEAKGWSHQCLCPTWKKYVERRTELSTFVLGPWYEPLVGRPFQLSSEPYNAFLRNLVGGETPSWWKAERDGWAGGTSESAAWVDVTRRWSFAEGFAPVTDIPAEAIIHNDEWERNDVGLLCLESWEDYYRWRNLPLSSPVALLLTFPLTLYYAIYRFGKVPCTVARMLQRPLRIHIVGTEKELIFLDLFRETTFLLPSDLSLELVFVVRSDMLPPSLQQKDGNGGYTIRLGDRLAIYLVDGTYGAELDPKFDCGTGPPDMVVAFNAGLFAYESWRSVLSFLDRNRGIVGVFSDYNEHSGVQCAGLGGARSSLILNPFRQPRAMPVFSMNLPQFTNGFVLLSQ